MTQFARPLSVLALLFLGMVLLAWLFQRRLIYFPDARTVAEAERILPGGIDVTLHTEDGLALGAIYAPAVEPSLSEGIGILVLPGNAGNRSDRAPLATALQSTGYSVLLVDYRGYGRNPGKPTEDGLLADARAAVRYLSARPDLDATRLVYFGESIGTGVAIALAREYPPAALVLRSPYTSLADLGRLHYPFLPAGLLLRDRFVSAERIAGISGPLLVITGARDSIIPEKNSMRLFELAPEPKHHLSVPGADHNDYSLLAGEPMIREIATFLDRYLS